MKEIKAYIRTDSLERTIEALQEKGVPGITIVKVHPVGYGFESNFSFKKVDIAKKLIDITKVELVCDNKDLDPFVNTIVDCSHADVSGDGLIFGADINEVVKIRTRERGTKFSEING